MCPVVSVVFCYLLGLGSGRVGGGPRGCRQTWDIWFNTVPGVNLKNYNSVNNVCYRRETSGLLQTLIG